MPGPLEGMRVVELGLWVAGPSAGAVLADWGADVVLESLVGLRPADLGVAGVASSSGPGA